MSPYSLLLKGLVVTLVLLFSIPTLAAKQPIYTLPVHVHLMSSKIDALNIKLNKTQVNALIARVNEIWRPAGIKWKVEIISTTPLSFEDRLLSSMRTGAQIQPNHVLSAILSGRRDTQLWNVYLVQNLTEFMPAPGVFIPQVQSVVSSFYDPAGKRDPGRILAHELGHSLTLAHIRCTREGNLMSPNCASLNRIRLSSDQINAARAQAALGSPTGR